MEPAEAPSPPSAPAAPPERPAPLGEGRQPFVDSIRGFALFGILLVNMAGFAHPLSLRGFDEPRGQSALDEIVSAAIRGLAEGKFYALFATLFGLGFALQLGRAHAHEGSFELRFARRLGALFLFGLLHGLFIWAGDILTTYALLGFGLLLFQRASARATLFWAVLGLLSSIALGGLIALVWRIALEFPSTVELLSDPALTGETAKMVDDAYRLYANGSYLEILQHRAPEFFLMLVTVLFLSAGQIFGLLLCGMLIGRSGVLAAPAQHLPLFRRAVFAGLVIGVPCAVVSVWGFDQLAELPATSKDAPLALFASMAALYVGGPALGAVYGGGLALLWTKRKAQALLAYLSPAGRMALTNYLLQSIVCTTLFNAYGFGLYGQVGAAAGTGIALVVFAAQVALSGLWLRHFRFGPAEWLWRAITYLQLPPMRRKEEAAATAP